jgi:anaerobic selenocysteine-containing dehydrogenase
VIITEVKSFCRICVACCGMILSLDEDDRIVGIRSDREHPKSEGYCCIKGLQSPEAHNSPARILHPLKRMPDGSFERIGVEQALDEIADQLRKIIERDGVEAVAAYRGTQSFFSSTSYRMCADWIQAIGSPSFFTNMSIDQSAKWVQIGRLGMWAAGADNFHDSDVMMIFGGNPLVSLSTTGFVPFNPTKGIRAAKARGMKFIVIDPRYTETARYADIFLQPHPGEDTTIASGLLRIILTEGWEDAEFCARYAEGMDALRRAVEPFTPEYVERRAGIPRDKLREAAELFALRSKRGIASSGTGPDMSPRSNLSVHMIGVLNVVCGRFLRPGDRVRNPGVLAGRTPRLAEVIAPFRSWEVGHKSRIRGVGTLFGEMMTGILADEILTPGKGQIKAMIVDGANPVNAFPDQRKTVKALKELELLVMIEPFMNATARLSHYIIPPKLQYERDDLPVPVDFENVVFAEPFSQYGAAVARPPKGSEVVDAWYVFWGLAKRLGKSVNYDGVPLDMSVTPTSEDLIGILTRNSQVPLDEVKKHIGGKVFDVEPQFVEPGRAEATGRFAVAPPDVVEELAEVAAESFAPGRYVSCGREFSHLLTSRRMREVLNSTYHDLPGIRRRRPYNPAYMNPADLAAKGLKSGDRVEIVSDHDRIPAIVEADDTLRPGVVSMTHAWGGMPGEETEYAKEGSATNALVSTDHDYEAINAMPRQSGIPVNVLPLKPPT